MNVRNWLLSATTGRAALIAGAAVAALSLGATAAHAEFFNDVKRTFQTDVPHFFQDDIPCAFGGQPTSGSRQTCKSGSARSADPAKAPLRGEQASPSPQPIQPSQQPSPAQAKPFPY